MGLVLFTLLTAGSADAGLLGRQTVPVIHLDITIPSEGIREEVITSDVTPGPLASAEVACGERQYIEMTAEVLEEGTRSDPVIGVTYYRVVVDEAGEVLSREAYTVRPHRIALGMGLSAVGHKDPRDGEDKSIKVEVQVEQQRLRRGETVDEVRQSAL